MQVLLVAGYPAPGGCLCSAARGREPLAGDTPGWGPAASEPVYRYRKTAVVLFKLDTGTRGTLVGVTAGAGFRVVSASHTMMKAEVQKPPR